MIIKLKTYQVTTFARSEVFVAKTVWKFEGKLHRDEGPAVEREDGHKAWYKNGKLHRGDGPAIEYADGRRDWYINGRNRTEEEFNNWKSKQVKK